MPISNTFFGLSNSDSFIQKLDRKELLKAGALISKDDCEEILGCKYQKDDWNFLGRYLTLKTQVEARGFFVTQSGVEAPGFRILNTDEMASFATKKLTKAMCSTYKTSFIMANHDTSALEEKEKKIYNNVKIKCATVAMMQQKILLDDFSFEN